MRSSIAQRTGCAVLPLPSCDGCLGGRSSSIEKQRYVNDMGYAFSGGAADFSMSFGSIIMHLESRTYQMREMWYTSLKQNGISKEERYYEKNLSVLCVMLLCLFALTVSAQEAIPIDKTRNGVDSAAEDEIPINEAHFPDWSFRGHVSGFFDTDKNGSLSEEEIENATVIDCSDGFAESLEGIEYLTNLRKLLCYGDSYLKKLDVSRNTQLEELSCQAYRRL